MAKEIHDGLSRMDEVQVRVIEAIKALGGSEEVSRIDKKYEALNNDWFRPKDMEHIPSKTDTRWHKNMRWALTALGKEKILTNPSRGYWKLSNEWNEKENPVGEYRSMKKTDSAKKFVKRYLSKLPESERESELKKLSAILRSTNFR